MFQIKLRCMLVFGIVVFGVEGDDLNIAVKYKLSTSAKTWCHAENDCRVWGGHVATPTSRKENYDLWNKTMNDNLWNKTMKNDLSNSTRVLEERNNELFNGVIPSDTSWYNDTGLFLRMIWLGINDITVEGQWTSQETSTVLEYENWGPSEPNGGRTENCAAMLSPDGFWIDVPCATKMDYICKKVLTEVPKKWCDHGPNRGRCGKNFNRSSGGMCECNPDDHPCCSAGGWCGVTVDHCECDGCVDYSREKGNQSTTNAILRSPANVGRDTDLRCIELNIEYFGPGNDVSEIASVLSWSDCLNHCQEESSCQYWTFKKAINDHLGVCELKTDDRGKAEMDRAISGKRDCPGPIQIPINSVCPIEQGFCVQSNNQDQDDGQMKLHNIDDFTEESRSTCLAKCRELPGATGCEIIWGSTNSGCYVHTSVVAKGNGRKNHMCWILSKCSAWTNECCSENCTEFSVSASSVQVDKTLMIALPCAAAFVLAGCILLVMAWYRTRTKYPSLLSPKPEWQFDSRRSVQEQVAELPYNILFEFPRLDITKKRLIGEGNFGEVWEASAEGIAAFHPRDDSELALMSKLSNIYARRRSLDDFWVKYFRQEYYPPLYSQEGRVAIKSLKSGARSEDYKNLASELKLLIHIGTHKNIVNLLGACTLHGPLWVLLEYCPYGDLQKFLRSKTLCTTWNRLDMESPDQICFFDLMRMAMEIAEGMVFLSLNGIVHRDLAARNILVGHNMEMKVADFGMARDVGGVAEEYKTESDAGIPVRWTAPEAMNLGIYSTSSDIWSYGIVLWELYSMGQKPYGGISNFEVKLLVERGERLEAPNDCPEGIFMIMKSTWNENPKDRPDFMEIFEILQEVKRNVFAPSSDYYTGANSSAEADIYIGDELIDCKPMIRARQIDWLRRAGMNVTDENVNNLLERFWGVRDCTGDEDGDDEDGEGEVKNDHSTSQTAEELQQNAFHNDGLQDDDVERSNTNETGL